MSYFKRYLTVTSFIFHSELEIGFIIYGVTQIIWLQIAHSPFSKKINEWYYN